MAWVIDLDGVMWRGRRPIDGSASAIGRLRAAGQDVLFVTNAAGSTVKEKEAQLAAMGVEAAGSVVTSAVAACRLLTPDDVVLVIGRPALARELADRAITVTDRPHGATAVLVGFDPTFDYAAIERAMTAVLAGARLIGTNHDPTFPTERGLAPGNGALVAAIATASGRQPVFAGKPHLPMVDEIRARLGPTGAVVGDRPDSDGALASALGYRFGMVLSGVVTDADEAEAADVVAADLRSLVDEVGCGWAQQE